MKNNSDSSKAGKGHGAIPSVEMKPTPKLGAALLVSKRSLLEQLANLPLANNRDALLALQVKSVALLDKWPNTSVDVRAAAVDIAESFPDLNYSDAPINPDGELVARLASIISKHIQDTNTASPRAGTADQGAVKE